MIKWLKDNSSFIIILLFLISIGGNVFLLSGCKTFQPNDYTVKGESAECNDVYITMGFYSVVEKSDSAFIGTVYNECQASRKETRKLVREKHCKELVYGADVVDEKQYEKYSQFLKCQK